MNYIVKTVSFPHKWGWSFHLFGAGLKFATFLAQLRRHLKNFKFSKFLDAKMLSGMSPSRRIASPHALKYKHIGKEGLEEKRLNINNRNWRKIDLC